MARVDKEFLEFLAAQNHMEVFHRLDSDNVSDATINTIISNYKSDYEAWLKVYPPHKDGRGHVDPEKLATAKKDPNFTNRDLDKIDEDHKNTTDPYSGVSEKWHDNPCYEKLLQTGLKLTAAHIAFQRLEANRYQQHGYSYDVSQRIGLDSAVLKALDDEIERIRADKSLSPAEQEQKIEQRKSQKNETRRDKQQTIKQGQIESMPERLAIRVWAEFAQGKISEEEARAQSSKYLKKVVEMGRGYDLYEMMTPKGSMYQKRLVKNDAKTLFLKSMASATPMLYQELLTYNDFFDDKLKVGKEIQANKLPMTKQMAILNMYGQSQGR